MKKVLILFDGEHFSKGAFDFVSKLNEVKPLLLTGVFLPSVDYTSMLVYYFGDMSGPLYLPTIDTDPEAIKRNIEIFKSLCEKHGIEYRIHDTISGSVLEGIRKETRYADLMVISGESFYSNLGRSSQEDYLKDTMHNTECPVVIVPEEYNFPKTAILAYNGTESSVFAIKQFAYLFPELSDISTLVVYATDKERSIPDLPYIEELAARHYSNLSFVNLDLDPKKYFNTWLVNNADAIVVTGSYGRSTLSEFFETNFVSEILRDHKFPIFIAHR